MATISQGNWSHRDPGNEIEENSIINGGNFSQLQPDTPIMVGKPLTITDGNWINVRQDTAWTVTGGNWAQTSYCTHLHPEWNLPVEDENCPHIVATDEIYIDGLLVTTIRHYEDTAV